MTSGVEIRTSELTKAPRRKQSTKHATRPVMFNFAFVFLKHRWCAWDSNPGQQDGRHRRIHWANPCKCCFYCSATNLYDAACFTSKQVNKRYRGRHSFIGVPNKASKKKKRNKNVKKCFKFFSGQALCGPCRDDTHRAKMFSQHEVIHMSKKTKEMHKKVIPSNNNNNQRLQ